MDIKKVERWFEIDKQLSVLKAEEIALRKEIFTEAFPNPVEGSKNKMPLAAGWILQGDHKINRKVDEAVVRTLATGDNTAPLIDRCFNFKPSLILKEFKALEGDDLNLLADAVTETPGTPSLKVVLPKR